MYFHYVFDFFSGYRPKIIVCHVISSFKDNLSSLKEKIDEQTDNEI